ncbi:UPF0184 protein AAEL002161 [Culex pipiens pallens]|uniref:UPF0184 protein AAEL002161 n=1 Tax=Culex pipiens pallens TaxID=42434 RepID=UPI00195332DA|nr:UPF0184 protein AAEL002161 [Culex pipiens pallens]
MTPNPKQNKQATSKPPEEPAAGGSTSNPEDNTSGEEFQEGEDEDLEVSLDEFDSVNNYLDSLNTALDAIEQRNDNLQEQLLSLLQSNREIRKSMQEEAEKRPPNGGAGASGKEPEAAASGEAMEH